MKYVHTGKVKAIRIDAGKFNIRQKIIPNPIFILNTNDIWFDTK